MTETPGATGWRRVLVPLLLVLAAAAVVPGAPPSRVHMVEIRGMAFHPAELTVATGDTVVWINRDVVPHTATASGPQPWDTGNLLPGEQGRYTAQSVGVINYICAWHPTMRAKLIIQ